MTSPPEAEQSDGGAWSLPERIGLTAEIERLRRHLAELAERSHPEVSEMLGYQLSPRSKYFRPVTVFACSRAVGGDDVESLIPGATAAELLHNYATVTDDIVDRDELRRGQPALHTRYGTLPAVMTGAYLTFAAFHQIADDEYLTGLFTDLGMRVAAVECRQWRLRRRPADVDTWLTLAGEDTGAMFAACARVATRDDRLSRFGYQLGTLYHGCDDIADLRGTLALGGHSDRDITDRIVTLPAAIAVRDPAVAELFSSDSEEHHGQFAEALTGALPRAEEILDELAADAEREARANAEAPDILVDLVRYTRELSAA